jgi:hypothetical protein
MLVEMLPIVSLQILRLGKGFALISYTQMLQ